MNFMIHDRICINIKLIFNYSFNLILYKKLKNKKKKKNKKNTCF